MMKTTAFVLGMAVAGAGGPVTASGVVAVSVQAPNPCALLTASDIQSLAPKASVGEGVPAAASAIGAQSCRYKAGAGVNRLTVNVVVSVQS